MSISLEVEPVGMIGSERCCFCRVPTSSWTMLEGRKPGDQVACCPRCGEHGEPEAVPTKAEWCEREAISCGPPGVGGHAEWIAARKSFAARSVKAIDAIPPSPEPVIWR